MKEIHATVHSRDILAFVEADRTKLICFRCGQPGHVRYNCMSWKVKLCIHHQNGGCTDPYCSFAHGEEELRTPWKMRCVRVVKQGGRLLCIGCNSSEHTFRKCPLHQNSVFV
jgi:ribosomal protein L37AE/L43A